MRVLRLMLPLALAAAACDQGPQFNAQRRLTSTVAIGATDTVLIVDSVVALEIHASPSQKNAIATLDLVLTASTATRAAHLIRNYQPVVDTAPPDFSFGGVTSAPRLKIGPVVGAALSGTAVLTIPANLALDVQERSSTVLLDRIGGPVFVNSIGSVRANGVQFDVTANVGGGNAIIDVTSGTAGVTASVDQGDIDVKLPLGVTLVISAIVHVTGAVVPTYPGLPPYFGMPGDVYRAMLGAANGVPIQLQTNAGNILIEERQ